MQILRQELNPKAGIAAGLLILSLATFALFGLDLPVQDLIVAVGALVCTALFLTQDKSLNVIVFLWLLSFCVGQRTKYVTRDLRIYAVEAVTTYVFLIFILREILRGRLPLSLGLPPLWIRFFFIFSALGLVTALRTNTPVDLIVSELKVFLSLILIFYVVSQHFNDLSKVALACDVLIAGSFLISLLGVVSYVAPDLIPLPPEILTRERMVVGGGFGRGGPSTWGIKLVSQAIAQMAMLALAKFDMERRPLRRSFYLIAFVVDLAEVYITGQRSVWMGLALGIAAYSLFLGYRRLGVSLFMSLGLIKLLPPGSIEWLASSFSLFSESSGATGMEQDTLIRRDLYEAAMDQIARSPILGGGWGSSGWVHNGFLQVAANLGLVATGLFCAFLASAWLRAIRTARKLATREERLYLYGLVSASVAGIGGFAGESVINHADLMAVFWLMLALLHKVTTLSENGG